MVRDFKEARLILPNPESKDQRWMIKYYTWNADLNKRVMVRDRTCNKIKDLRKRRLWVEMELIRINGELKEGRGINLIKLKELEEAEQLRKLTEAKESRKEAILLKDAVNTVVARKSTRSEYTQRTYANIRKYFFAWLDKNGRGNMRLREFDLEMAREYLHYFLSERKAGHRYHNNIKMFLGTIFKELEENDYPTKNYFAKIPKLKEGIGRNVAYDKDQQIQIREMAQSTLPELVPVIETLYYTLMRISELVRLQVKDIYAVHPNKIYLPGFKSKNRQERHIEVPMELAKIFGKMNIKSFPPDYYVFSDNTMTPGPKMYTVMKLAKRYLSNVKKKLNLSNEYTLYSWKHTGVMMAKNAKIADVYIMMQGGWTDFTAYNKYLKSLGLMANDEFRDNMPELGSGNSKKL